MRPRLAPVAALLFVCAVSCDSSPKGSASATASSPPPPPCSDALPRPEQIARCEKAEALCCTAMMAGTPKDAADYWDRLALACSGGAETSCEIVRDSDRPPVYKLDAFDKACTVMGRWPCRMSAMLAILTASERAPQIIDNYCRQTDDKTFRIATASIKCDPADTKAIAELAPMATECLGGALSACKSLAGIDGNAREVFYDAAWIARGIPRDQAEEKRVQVTNVGGAEPKGKVEIRALDASGKTDGARSEGVRAFLVDPLGRCVAWARESTPRSAGKVRYEAVIDKTGRIAHASVSGKDLDDGALSLCLRGVLQDTSVRRSAGGEPGAVETWMVEVSVAP